MPKFVHIMYVHQRQAAIFDAVDMEDAKRKVGDDSQTAEANHWQYDVIKEDIDREEIAEVTVTNDNAKISWIIPAEGERYEY